MDAINQETLNSANWDTVPFDNSYARLPDKFHTKLDPTPVSAPRLIKVNHRLAASLGIDPEILDGPDSASSANALRLFPLRCSSSGQGTNG